MSDLITKYHISNRERRDIFLDMETFVLENYTKVPIEVWNNTTFCITPHLSREKLVFGKGEYSPKPRLNERVNNFLKKRYDSQIKIDSITFTRDYSDDDFSVDFNNGAWSFLHNEAIVPYYLLIFNHLNKSYHECN